jgi:hypothetical protein
MKRVLSAIILIAFTTQIAIARGRNDFPNSGTCKSGEKVRNLKACKENGGKK